MTLCEKCKYGHYIDRTGATYCVWWRSRVKPDGWCYKGEEERNGGKQ